MDGTVYVFTVDFDYKKALQTTKMNDMKTNNLIQINTLLFVLFTLLFSQFISGQGPFQSINPKTDAGTSEANMLHLNLQALFELKRVALSGGIIGQISGSGEIRLKVYEYDQLINSGRGNIMYEIAINETTTEYSGLGISYPMNTLNNANILSSATWNSTQPRTSAFYIDRKESTCVNDFCPSAKNPIPVVLEISISENATLEKFAIPGIGKFNYEPFKSYQLKVKNLANNTNLKFAVIGDYGYDTPAERYVAEMVKSWNVDFVISLGDDSYADKLNNDIDDNVGKYYSQFIYPYNGKYGIGNPLGENKFWSVLGNHDYKTPPAGESEFFYRNKWLNYYTFPQMPAEERYYEKVIGDVHLFALNFNWQEPHGRSEDSQQALWLRDRLAASTAKFKLVFGHQTPYSSLSPVELIDDETGIGTGHGSLPVLQWHFKEWGADIVLSGHEHIYERIVMDDGMTYIVNGVGGAKLYSFVRQHLNQVRGITLVNGAMLGEVIDNQITFEFIGTDFEIGDRFTINSSNPRSGKTLTKEDKILKEVDDALSSVFLSPNPSKDGNFSLNFDIKERIVAKVEIRSLSGQLIFQKEQQYVEKENHNLWFGKNDVILTSGFYIVRVVTDKFIKSFKLVVQ